METLGSGSLEGCGGVMLMVVEDVDGGSPVTIAKTVIVDYLIKRDLYSQSRNANLVVRGTRRHLAFAVSQGSR